MASVPFWTIAACIALMHLGTNLLTPLYGTFVRRFELSALTLTQIFSVYVITLLPTLLVAGRLSDRLGYRLPVVTGLALSVGSSMVLSLSRSVEWLFVGRGLQGLGMGIATGAAGAAGAALQGLEPHRRPMRAAAVGTLAFAGGAALGPVVSGAIVQYTGAPTSAPFILHAAVGLAALTFCAVRCPAPGARATKDAASPDLAGTVWLTVMRVPFLTSALGRVSEVKRL